VKQYEAFAKISSRLYAEQNSMYDGSGDLSGDREMADALGIAADMVEAVARGLYDRALRESRGGR
jgi:hypothetical protein